MLQDFGTLKQMVDELNADNSSTAKLMVLKRYKKNEFIREVLHYTYTTFKQYYVTPDNLRKNEDLVEYGYTNLFKLLDDLAARKISGHDALANVNGFIEKNKKYAELILNIFERNLKVRLDSKSINKVFKDCIPTFDVALANKYEGKVIAKVNFKKDTYFVSRKLDGCRCIVFCNGDDVKLISRQGKEFKTLDVLKEEFRKLKVFGLVFDGEVCIVDDNGNEHFDQVQRQILRKNYTIEKPKYNAFDCLTQEEFDAQTSKRILSERLKQLNYIIRSAVKSHTISRKRIEVLEQTVVKSNADLEEYSNYATQHGWEGLIIRKDCEYKGKRSDDMLKLKKFHDDEYTVKDIETGPFRVVVDNVEVVEQTLTNVIIEHKGNPVSVGSGFSLEERRAFYNNPKEIIGKVITVKYFETCKDKNGKESLRFPTLKAIHGRIRQT